ncbi:hypothetical protein F4X33_12715 [Candidatus Poribacteria bacterium]|nr:hypothetical protein [Candidatus Poribacteria bacterium]
MTSNRMFYIGIGCLFSTLCWTVVLIAKQEQNLPNLEVNRLTCKELRVLDKDDKVGIHMYDRPYGDGGGSDLWMIFKDNSILRDDTPSQGGLWISDRGLSIHNWEDTRIASIHVERGNGGLSLRKRDGSIENLFIVDTENAKYSKTHCPCNNAFDRSMSSQGQRPVKN